MVKQLIATMTILIYNAQNSKQSVIRLSLLRLPAVVRERKAMEEEADRSSFIVGLIENRAKEVGVAAFDLRSASLHLSQYIEASRSYQNTKTLLHFYDPLTIIVSPNKMAADGMIGVSELVDKQYTSNKKVIMPRSCFDDTKGSIILKDLAAKEPSVLGLDTYYKQYYLCLAAFAATIRWIESEKGIVVTNNSLSVTFNGSFDHMNIDATSVHNLEIIDSSTSGLWGSTNKKRSLFQILKTTRTIGGTRLLRANLLQPLKDIETINARLDCLDELMSNEELFFGLIQSLRKFPKETDRVLCQFAFKHNRVTAAVVGPPNSKRSQELISNIIVLKTALDALPFLSKEVKNAKSFLLSNIYKTVCLNEKYERIRKRIGEIIVEDVLHTKAPFLASTQQCFAVKTGIDGLLDIARRVFCDTSEAIHNLAKKYREEFQLPNLKIPYNSRQGFYFSIPLKDVNGDLSKIFIKVAKHGKNIHCTSLELASLNVRNRSAAAECYLRTEVCLEENGPMAIDAGRHPILETIHTEFIPNNVFHSEASNMVIVMGPNMSGKSTYLQQVCLIVILAQIGCYVPARFASLRVVDRIFTRIGTTESLESNSSTFMTEMKETAFIMQNVSPRSLVVMDELGRATSSEDGYAIAWSCCEHLLSLKAYTIFATHMEGLSELATIYPNVKVLHLEVEIKNNRLDFKFCLQDGPRRIPHYGLILARMAGLPGPVIETAENVTQKIATKGLTKMESNCAQYESIQLAYRMAQRLVCLKYSNQSEEDVRRALQSLQASYREGRLD
ncbi:MUTS-like protein 4 isoform X2 [Wolffia australiana]